MNRRTARGILVVWMVILCAAIPREHGLVTEYRNGAVLDPPLREEAGFSIHLPLVVGDQTQMPEYVETAFGIEVQPLGDQEGLHATAGGGTSYTRLNGVFWSQVEPEEGQRDWGALSGVEAGLLLAAERDLQSILVVRSTPTWAQKYPGVFCGPVKEEKFEAFGDFLYDLVSRYSQAPYFARYWELYNEPDVNHAFVSPLSAFGCWGEGSDAYYGGGYYARMLAAVYPRIKQADPQAQVLIGGLLMSCNPATGKCISDDEALASKFFAGILAENGGDYFDGVAFHNYDIYQGHLGGYWSRKWDSAWDSTGPALVAKARFLKDALKDFGVSGKFLMNTETAVLCGPATEPPGSPGCESDPASDFELTKAYYVGQSYAAAIAEGLQANIWYSLTGWRNSGLLYPDYSPRPAFEAYEFSRERLGGAVFLGPLQSQDTGGDSSLGGYKFERPDGRLVWITWARDRESHPIAPAVPPDAAWDVFGNPISPLNPAALSITREPRYFEWNP